MNLIDTRFADDPVAKSGMRKLFEDRRHFQVGADYTDSQIKNFTKELFNSISTFDMSYSKYHKPKRVDINERFECFNILEKKRNLAYCMELYEQSVLLDTKDYEQAQHIIRGTFEDILKKYDESIKDSVEELSDEELIHRIKIL